MFDPALPLIQPPPRGVVLEAVNIAAPVVGSPIWQTITACR
jgi:hypothetical protein